MVIKRRSPADAQAGEEGLTLRLTREQLDHVRFLSETVLENRKRALMPDVVQCLLYIVKTLPEAEVPDAAAQEMVDLMYRIERELIEENERLKEIRNNMAWTNRIVSNR
jgi:hypothetical protein